MPFSCLTYAVSLVSVQPYLVFMFSHEEVHIYRTYFVKSYLLSYDKVRRFTTSDKPSLYAIKECNQIVKKPDSEMLCKIEIHSSFKLLNYLYIDFHDY